ncbi:MAG TPA: type II secretion system protein GspM [Kofleriaceae bacterium]|nr:type II secretion system protein GspM [Kofleriaceae bacterium]
MAFADRAQDFWDRISPRERTLVVLLAVATPIVLAIWLGSSIKDGLAEREARIEKMRRALVVIADLKSRGPREAQADDPLKDIGPEPLSLDTYLDNAAKKAGFTIKNTTPHTPVTRNGFVTTSISFSIDDLEIDKLKTFLQEVETTSKAVAITTLETSRDRRDRTKVDAKLIVSTYSREKTEASGGAGGGTGGSAAAPKKGG